MHLMIPFASACAEPASPVLRDLSLPTLGRLLQRMTPVQRDEADEYSLNPPHERALAAAWGWTGEPGALPFAARAAAADGLAVSELPWGLLTPVHWQVGREHITLADPAALGLDAAESQAILEAVRELFESEGFTLVWGAAGRWYAAHPSFEGLATASLDRVIGRNVDLWLQGSHQARLVRRLQNEVQMLLYNHPLNDAREARGLRPVNSFWLSGCGRFQPQQPPDTLQVDERLRAPLLADDWAAWAEAWRALDAGPLTELLARTQRAEAVRLTLCGERSWVAYETAVAPSLWQRLRSGFSPPDTAHILGDL
jgi:hypothetical protein